MYQQWIMSTSTHVVSTDFVVQSQVKTTERSKYFHHSCYLAAVLSKWNCSIVILHVAQQDLVVQHSLPFQMSYSGTNIPVIANVAPIPNVLSTWPPQQMWFSHTKAMVLNSNPFESQVHTWLWSQGLSKIWLLLIGMTEDL